MKEAHIVRPVLAEVDAERDRQEERWGEQSHPDGTGLPEDAVIAQDDRMVCQQAAREGILTYRHILQEEVSEAFAEADPRRLRAELIQVSAVAAAWVECIDRRLRAGAA